MNWNIAKRAMRLKQIHEDGQAEVPVRWRLTKKQAKRARKAFRKFQKQQKAGYYE